MRPRKDIVIIQTAYLGDCVLTLPLAKTLKECPQTGRITVVCRPQVKALFKACPSVDKIMVYNKKGKEKGVAGTFNVIKKIKRKNYYTAFLPQRSFRSGLITFLSRIPERVGFSRGGASIFLTSKCKYDWNKHEVGRLLDMAAASGCTNKKRKFEIELDKKLVLKYGKIFNKNNKKIIGIAPQSKWPTKCWPKEKYNRLIEMIKENYRVVVFGSEREEWPAAVNLTSRTSLKELLAAVNSIDILISNDSGLMHIGAALGKSVIAIFGATVPGMGFAPYGEKNTIIQKELDCRPCSLHGSRKCPLGHFKCMNDIPPESVKKAIDNII